MSVLKVTIANLGPDGGANIRLVLDGLHPRETPTMPPGYWR
jgi:hypothetical protein